MTAAEPSQSAWLRCYVTENYPCSYFPDREARSQVVAPAQEVNGGTYSQLVRLGFRRSGLHIYRPHCDQCQACIPMRVHAPSFRPNRSQSRAWRQHAGLQARVIAPAWSAEHFELYRRYQARRHAGGGMDDGDAEQYAQFLVASRVETRMVEFRLPGGELIMVAVIDLLDDGLSAVYTYYDPDAAGSLGTYAILWQLAQCQENDRPWLYLGYWIPGHGKMDYKARYQPAQVLLESHWQNLEQPGLSQEQQQTGRRQEQQTSYTASSRSNLPPTCQE